MCEQCLHDKVTLALSVTLQEVIQLMEVRFISVLGISLVIYIVTELIHIPTNQV